MIAMPFEPNSEEQLNSRNEWENVFTAAGETGCLIEGSRHGIEFQVVNFRDEFIVDENTDPSVIQISQIKRGEFQNGIVIGPISGLPTNADIASGISFRPTHNEFTEIQEARERIPEGLSLKDYYEISRHMDFLKYKDAEDYPERIYFKNNFYDIDSFRVLEKNGLLLSVEILEISGSSKTVSLIGHFNPNLHLKFDIRSGYRITRESVLQPDGSSTDLYMALPIKKISAPQIERV